MSAWTSQQLRPVLDAAMDARAENLTQDTLIWDPDPECNSLAEYVAVLLRHGVPVDVVGDVARLVRRLAESNAREGRLELDACGTLDELVARLHHDGARAALSYKQAAGMLRPHLAVVERARREVVDGVEYFRACCAIKDVVMQLAEQVLRGPGLRNALGGGRHDLLLSLLPASSAETAA